jgi:CO/xanthine dehydrogenase Mo-binding subunit
VIDKSCGEGAVGLAYAIAHRQVSHAIVDPGVPVGYWRSVGYSINGYYAESLIDECAAAANVDPYQFRRRLLQRSPRHLRVLDEAARAAGWGRPVTANRGERAGRGIALVESFGSVVAVVLELSVTSVGEIRVGRMVAAVDCGLVIDPNNVRAQVVSGLVFGLAAALDGRVDIEQGRVIQGNFADIRVPVMGSTPRIQVEILPSSAPPGGVGEIATPPVAPALTNAFFAATRIRRRDLPLRSAQVL